MKRTLSAACALALLAFPAVSISPLLAQDSAENALPRGLQTGDEVPWIYRGSDVPQDKDWLFGELENGLRYAVRRNSVPPEQASIRIRIDAGSLHERDDEQGFAHLMEHLSFRESKYLGPAQAIPTWQRLGATFGSDTNAETSPTHTVYKLDLPGITPASLDESFKLLSGMIREPVLSQANVATEVPIVLAEKRERGGAGFRVDTKTRETLFAGQRLANRLPIGTEETLEAATGKALQEFHQRWYRPENTVIVVAGDADPVELARLVEKWFGDWQGTGPHVEAPDFGDPVAPAGADPANPLGEMAVVVEPDMPRALTYAIMRPWRPVNDTIVYNEGLLLDAIGQAIINRRLRSRARSGGSFLEAQVYQDDVSRSTDATFVTVIPLSNDWQTALADTRALIADALATPPTQEEIDREVAEFDVAFASELEQKAVLAGSKLADQIVQAVDIRETVAAPETVLNVFRGMSKRLNPQEVHARTKALFEGDVIRAVYVTPEATDGDVSALKLALSQEVKPDGTARLAAQAISFDDLPPIGEPGAITAEGELGITGIPEIEKVEFANGTRAILWANDAEPGRVTVKVRFGAGYRAFSPEDAPYVALGEMALVGAGLGELGQEELDRITTGRKMGFDFGIDEGSFTFTAQTRSADVSDQLYLFAAKLGMPRWDESPILRSKAAAGLAYDALSSSPGGVLNRDLDFLLRNRDPRFITPNPKMMAEATPEGFRKVWEPILKQGPVEVLVFGEFDRDEVVETLRRTFGALDPRTPIPASVAGWLPEFPDANGGPTVLNHRGDPNQAAAVIAWPSGGGIEGLRESRQLEILTQLFNNRLMDVMREKTGASYAPQVVSDWPRDLSGGGTIMALAQLRPEDVPVFFSEAEKIAADLSINPPDADELNRVTEPLRQLISRASTGNNFWLYQLEGASFDPRRVGLLRSLLVDYSQTSPEVMQLLATRYLTSRKPWQLAIIPEGQALATSLPAGRSSGSEVSGR
ncbi:insulinase family protein [Altererythrobacter arenosus]|uniref:Insulinase family protein n=1 Tax=Altererythrobacter arenosus TaxID=3032592 RepID=A0ABY8FT28_9SPHN|nr:insulinase family protein [Altererythrobacter sp. CAU 1644]WFL76576.1 insulinase family protein [Altererythrobacter sp. CAU 1644]